MILSISKTGKFPYREFRCLNGKLLSTSQQQISRLESPGYEGHPPSMLRRVAEVLHAKVRVAFEPAEARSMRVAERPVRYGIKHLAKRRKWQLMAPSGPKKRKIGFLVEEKAALTSFSGHVLIFEGVL
jgi:hypothetical protein